MASADDATSVAPRGGSPLVLIVDDHADTHMVWALFLHQHGFTVETAADGEQGITKAVDLRPDVILLDFALPILSGAEVTRLLKARADTKQIPIIAVTGWGHDPARQAGCDGYVAKPCMPDALIAEIRRVLAGSSPPPARS